MAKIVVLGAGAMGLAAAYRALCLGHQVTLLEAGPEPGGMAAHFDFGGVSIERYYHFVCKSDAPTFALMHELGIGDRMRWRATSMAYFIGGKLHRWGDPISLLRFPLLSLIEKIRYGVLMFVSTRVNSWASLEHISAKSWIEGWCGKHVYATLWKPLFDLKFYAYADNVSASWIWTRIRRIGRSRKSLMQEELGHIDGGTQTLVDALMAGITAKGGDVRLATAATLVLVQNGRVTGVAAGDTTFEADHVISTIPTPLISRLIPDLPDASRAAYDAIENIGVICVLLKLKRSVTPHFWVNIVDPTATVPGMIEFTNLRAIPSGETIVYVPFYMPTDIALWDRPDDVFFAEAMASVRLVNPAIAPSDLIEATLGRLKHAQPVCPPGFQAMIPPVQTPLTGLQIADTCFYYPEDRGISESVRLGQEMAANVAV